MALVSLNDILPVARREGRAVAAFNYANYETAAAIIDAAEVEQQPVILQVYQRLMADRHIDALAAMSRKLAESASVPVALHLDHGASLEQVKLAIDCGFTSVMLDGSQLPMDENIGITAQAVALAHAADLAIEAEIGHVPFGTSGDRMSLSTPGEAEEFVAKTGVDVLAVSIGTSHGYYREAPEVDVDLARAIADKVTIPLVLHGGSGTPLETIQAVIAVGFAKVNVATEFQHGFQKCLADELARAGDSFVPLDRIMAPVSAHVLPGLRKKIRDFAG